MEIKTRKKTLVKKVKSKSKIMSKGDVIKFYANLSKNYSKYV